MKEKREDKLLRNWKIRQEQEGYDVSGVTTLEEAEHFFDKKEPTKEELIATAKEMGLDVKASMKKAEIAALIEEAKNAAAETPSGNPENDQNEDPEGTPDEDTDHVQDENPEGTPSGNPEE